MNTDISWLPRSIRKGNPIPNVVYDLNSDIHATAFYVLGSHTITIVDYDEEIIASSIAHEYCHFLQDLNNTVKPAIKLDFGDNYEEDIKQYFSTQPHEMESLLFEYKHSKTWQNDWWLNKLLKEIKECNER